MTRRKIDTRLPNRTPAYEIGAAELGISAATWDRWVKQGILPPATLGAPESTPRWRWADVDQKLSGNLRTYAMDRGEGAGVHTYALVL
jgi:hypothetical protein